MGGVSFVEVLILYERWVGERLLLGTALPKYQRRGRPIIVTVTSGVAEMVIWRSYRFIGALFRALKDLPGGLVVSFLAKLVAITVGFYALARSSVVMGCLADPKKVGLVSCWMLFWSCLAKAKAQLLLFWVAT